MTFVRFALRLALLSAAFALGTSIVGWAAVPLTGAAWGVIDRHGRVPGRVAALAATLAWSALFIMQTIDGRIGALAAGLGQSFGVPALVLVAVTVALPALLAWSSATTAWLLARSGNRGAEVEAV